MTGQMAALAHMSLELAHNRTPRYPLGETSVTIRGLCSCGVADQSDFSMAILEGPDAVADASELLLK